MSLNCGCTFSCCGICALAEAAGRPRLTRDNAAEWEPPNLHKLRGAKHRAERDAEDGVPSLWYWQMEGTQWGLDGESFDVAKRAYARLAASQEVRSKESGKRIARELNKDSPEAVARRRKLHGPLPDFAADARREEEAELAEERARRWRELRPVLRRCGLERVASGLESLRDSSVLSALYEPPASCAPRGSASLGLLQCLDAFLRCEDGGTRSEVEAAAAGNVAGLGLTKSEAASLHRTLVLARFERFVEAALTALNTTVLSSPSEGGCPHAHLISTEGCFDVIYAACSREADGGWRHDLDVAECMGSLWAGDAPSGSLRIEETLRGSVLRDAADGVLRFAHARYRIRAVLLETLPRSGGVWQGHRQMLRLLQSAKAGIAADGEYSSLLWFLGQAEHTARGRLWAPSEGVYPATPRHLCALACGSSERVAALAKVLCNSVVLREPVRLFLDAHWQGYCERAWGHPAGWCDKRFYIDTLEQHMRNICCVLLPVAIRLPGCLGTVHLSRALLVALEHVASCSANEAETIRMALRTACRVPHQIAVQHACGFAQCCDGHPVVRAAFGLCMPAENSMTAFLRRVRRTPQANVRSPFPSLCVRAAAVSTPLLSPQIKVPPLFALALDAVRMQALASMSVSPHDFASFATHAQHEDLHSYVRSAVMEHIHAVCPRAHLCRGALDGCRDWRHNDVPERPCPDTAITFLLEAIAPYNRRNTSRVMTPPPPPYEPFDPDDWEHRDDDGRYLGNAFDREYRKMIARDKRDREHVWAPFAYP